MQNYGHSLLSSSLTLESSSYLSNPTGGDGGYELEANFELASLHMLSSNLERLVLAAEYNDYSDAEIEADGNLVGVVRAVLATRSPFFHKLFKDEKADGAGKPKYLLSELIPGGYVGYDVFVVILNYLYTGRVRAPQPEVATCVDEACTHQACVPVVDYHVQMMYACATFEIKTLVALVEHCLLSYVNKVYVEELIPILKVAIHAVSGPLISHCVQRIAHIDVDNVLIERTILPEIVNRIKSLRLKSNYEEEHNSSQLKLLNYLNRKVIKRIYKALDSDDIQLVKLLLEESNLSLDATYALHYAAGFCPPKLFDEVWSLGPANLNLRNSRGYSVLHIAVRRKDPSIVLRVLEKGSCVMDPTWDGRTALTIRKRLTRPKDFHETVEPGKEANVYRLCIEVLEREMWGSPWSGSKPAALVEAVDDLQMTLLLLENRVAMARSLFPEETKLSMHVAHADSTSEFGGLSVSAPSSHTNSKEDSNEMQPKEVERLQQRFHALQNTVEAIRRFFPSCLEVVDKLLEDDTLGDLLLEEGSPEEQRTKRMRYMELKADLTKAFNKDTAKNKRWASRRLPSPVQRQSKR